ncbi:ankyrin repeat domain-containing protein 13B-like [Abrus precatorius]|uniref:Ankyrin repeat domain-containing protein 13B-like n=1 Tax=Abrus precatorius TaxID=3816 RepID=A0A8B8M724_ABRPR|nr:ankyrin repeat domain-containing protein 13B-like [Abrus precatorius]
MADFNVSAYAHSSVHKAIVLKNHDDLQEILARLPKLCNPYNIKNEAAAIHEDDKVTTISAVVHRRDVPNGDTPLHLAAKLGDVVATEMLIAAGANYRLKNKEGWTALREAIINKQNKVAKIMITYSWNDYDEKWHRRLPRYIGTMRRMRDFYMEITFHFESSVIPFISRIAPSDTYKIWKRGGNMRADMTLAGFDGMKIKRSDQSLFFLGDGLEDQKKVPGSLCMVSHKKKEVVVVSAPPEDSKPTDREVRLLLDKKSRSQVCKVGLDLSQALLAPQMTWRGKEKKESVGTWKAKVYEMQNVVLTVKSKALPGAPPDPKSSPEESTKENEKFEDTLTDDDRKQLEVAMNASDENSHTHKSNVKKEKKGRSSGHREKGHHKGKNNNSANSRSQVNASDDTEYKKGMMPVLWLSHDFPLKIEELLPMLDILAEKVKAIKRLRELLTTTLPKETFPVKVAIPVVSTVRVLVTFTRFEELQQVDEFESAPSSPTSADLENSNIEQSSSTSSWYQWMKTPSRSGSSAVESSSRTNENQDLFAIPSGYTWLTYREMVKKQQEKNKKKPRKS